MPKMPTLAGTLRAEIRRLAARELKKTQRPLRRVQKQLRALKLLARGQKRALASLERRLSRIKQKAALRGAGPAAEGPTVAPAAVRELRSRLQMTRVEFARVLDVSPGSIFGWETGRTVPRGVNASKILEVARRGTAEARVFSRRSGAAAKPGPQRRPRARRRA
jgi:DNA-binding transcriptional regulator YiaG